MPTPTPYPVESLTDHAMCDEVLEELQVEIEDLTFRQLGYDHRDDKASTRATNITEELAEVTEDIADLNEQLAGMTATNKRRPKREAELREAVKRQGDLTAAKATGGPVVAFRVVVNLRQVMVQIAELNEAKTEVTAHRATLSA